MMIYTVLDVPEVSCTSEKLVQFLLDILGWAYKPGKDALFSLGSRMVWEYTLRSLLTASRCELSTAGCCKYGCFRCLEQRVVDQKRQSST
eukprot:6455671-Amphidinium_carterae.1